MVGESAGVKLALSLVERVLGRGHEFMHVRIHELKIMLVILGSSKMAQSL
jgi:hypothetical protein